MLLEAICSARATPRLRDADAVEEEEVPASPGSRVFSEAQWQWISATLPIACVDVLPVVRDTSGGVVRIGLIERESPLGRRLYCV